MLAVPSFMSGRVSAPGLAGALCTVVIGAGVAGCEADLGVCDMTKATIIVYTKSTDGTPLYAGQAIVQDSCSGFCHAANATGALRSGAPHGLNFDVGPLTAQSPAGADTILRDGIAKVRDEASDMYDEIESGLMPPGKAGMRTVQTYKQADGTDAHLPTISDATGKATVRNWLVCGAPVISGVTGAPNASAVAATIKDSQVVAAMPTMVGTSFADIYTGVLMTTCPTCHSPTGPAPYLDLTNMTAAYNGLVNKDASTMGACSGKGKLVVPMDCKNSILYQKLQPMPMCGTQMPQGLAPLSQTAVDAVCSWIMAGAKM